MYNRTSLPLPHEVVDGMGVIINCNGVYFSSKEQIAYFLTQEAVHVLVHFKFLRVYSRVAMD